MAGLLALTGCGGGDSAAEPTTSSTAVASESLSPSTSVPPPAPVYVESETCRTSMAPLIDIMLANDEHSLAYETFHSRYTELENKLDKALLACSNDVNQPARMIMVKFGLADFGWGYCKGTKCDTDLIARDIRAGLRVATTLRAKVNLTQ